MYKVPTYVGTCLSETSTIADAHMHSEHGTRKPVPNRDSTSGADYNESATKVLFTRIESARQSGAKKEKRIARFGRLSARWCGNKEIGCIRGIFLFFCFFFVARFALEERR